MRLEIGSTRIEVGQKQRKTRSDKKFKITPALTRESHDKLCRLALGIGSISKTKLSEMILEFVLNDPDFVVEIQEKLGSGKYRVIPVVDKDGIADY